MRLRAAALIGLLFTGGLAVWFLLPGKPREKAAPPGEPREARGDVPLAGPVPAPGPPETERSPRGDSPPGRTTSGRSAGPASDRAGAPSGSSHSTPAPREGTADLAGEVLDPEGNPIAGATVRIFPVEARSEAIVDRVARSDISGRFQLAGLSKGIWTLSATHPRRLGVSDLLVEVPSEDALIVVMEPDRPAKVRVVGEEGSPLSNARILARAWAGRLDPLPLAQIQAVTGPDGEASLQGLPADDAANVAIEASLPGRPGASAVRTAGELRSKVLVIELESGATLEGVVLDGGGAPQANVQLVLLSSAADPVTANRPRWSLQSISSGEFKFTGLTRGEFTLHADGGDRGRRKVEGIQVGPGREGSPLEVRLAPPGSPEAEAGAAPPPPFQIRSLKAGPVPGTGTIRGRLKADGPIPPFAIGLISQGSANESPEMVFRQTARRPEFRCGSVREGIYTVLLLVDGEIRGRAEGIEVSAGAVSGPVELILGSP